MLERQLDNGFEDDEQPKHYVVAGPFDELGTIQAEGGDDSMGMLGDEHTIVQMTKWGNEDGICVTRSDDALDVWLCRAIEAPDAVAIMSASQRRSSHGASTTMMMDETPEPDFVSTTPTASRRTSLRLLDGSLAQRRTSMNLSFLAAAALDSRTSFVSMQGPTAVTHYPRLSFKWVKRIQANGLGSKSSVVKLESLIVKDPPFFTFFFSLKGELYSFRFEETCHGFDCVHLPFNESGIKNLMTSVVYRGERLMFIKDATLHVLIPSVGSASAIIPLPYIGRKSQLTRWDLAIQTSSNQYVLQAGIESVPVSSTLMPTSSLVTKIFDTIVASARCDILKPYIEAWTLARIYYPHPSDFDVWQILMYIILKRDELKDRYNSGEAHTACSIIRVSWDLLHPRKPVYTLERFELQQNLVRHVCDNASLSSTMVHLLDHLHLQLEEYRLDTMAYRDKHVLLPLLIQIAWALNSWSRVAYYASSCLGLLASGLLPLKFENLQTTDIKHLSSIYQDLLNICNKITHVPMLTQQVTELFGSSVSKSHPLPLLLTISNFFEACFIASNSPDTISSNFSSALALLRDENSGLPKVLLYPMQCLTSYLTRLNEDNPLANPPTPSILSHRKYKPEPTFTSEPLVDLDLAGDDYDSHDAAAEANERNSDSIQAEVHERVTRLIFRKDKLWIEALRTLQYSSPVSFTFKVQETLNEHELVRMQQEIAQNLASRALAMPVGFGLLTFRSKFPLTTEKLEIPGFNFAFKMKPSNTLVGVDKAFLSDSISVWGLFHNGVAAGLSVSTEATHINNSWLMFNKPDELNSKHAGFLLGLGLNKHLKTIATWHAFNYSYN